MTLVKEKNTKSHYIYTSEEIWEEIRNQLEDQDSKWDSHIFLNLLFRAANLLSSCKTCYGEIFLNSRDSFKREKRLKVFLAPEDHHIFSYKDLRESGILLNNDPDISLAVHPFLFILFIVGSEIHERHRKKMNFIASDIRKRSRFRYIP